MKLLNKKTRDIGKPRLGDNLIFIDTHDGHRTYCYETLDAVIEEWEVYEEPKQSALRFVILSLTNFIENEPSGNVDLKDCEDMLKKLEAWERLKDKEFKFKDWEVKNGCKIFFGLDDKSFNAGWLDENIVKDLDLLFGSENE